MKTKLNGTLTLLLALFVQFTFAQEKTVTGVVSDESGPLPGVSILKKGTSTGTETDFNGNYNIKAKQGDILIFSFVGMASIEKTVSSSSKLDVTMQSDNVLDEVIVTALGIKKETRAVGYAVQKVTANTIAKSNATDALSALTGQAAGVKITNASGSAGGGSRIVIRGQTSLSGDNQALVVVDGVRISNSQFNTEARTAGVAGSNRGMDINPADIESINVLKGGAAAALYGVQGGNGVIVITTKKGKAGRMKVNVRSNVTLTNVTNLPKLQNTFVQGLNGVWEGPETGRAGSWGPNKENLYWDGSNYDYDKNGRIVEGNTTGNLKKFEAYDVFELFKTGVTFENNISISGGGDKTTFRLSYGDMKEEGIIPKNEFNRRTLTFAGSAKVNDRLNVNLSASYTNSDSYRIQQGSNTSGLMLGLLRTPMSFDNSNGFSNAQNEVSAYEFEDGSQRNYRGGVGYDNPYWTINNSPYTDNVNRFVASLGLDYKITDWLNFNANIGLDTYSENRNQFFDIGSRTNPAGTIILDDYNYRHMDSYLNLNGDVDLSEDINFSYVLGANIYSESYTQNYAQGDGLAIKGFNNITNAATVSADYDLYREKNLGFYTQLDFSYQKMLYLTLTGRQDYLSTLENPQDFNLGDLALFYPSANIGFVFSELLEDTSFLNFGKLRLSWSQTGSGAPTPYATSTAFEIDPITDGWSNGYTFPYNGTTGFQAFETLGNSTLKPSTVTTQEIGLDLRMLKNRVSLDLAYYKRLAVDQILAVPIARSTGYTSSFFNSGELESNGFEATLNLGIIKKDDFSWNLGVNFDKNETIVNELAEGVESQYLGGFVSYNLPGERFGQIYGGAYLRDDNGTLIINDDPSSSNYGLPIADPNLKVLGDPTPDFTIGFNNSFTFKNWSLDFLLEWKEGGEMWNGTEWALSYFGRSEITENRGEQLIIEGVKESDGSTNDIVATIGQHFYRDSGLSGFGSVDEEFVQDTSWLRLRTLNLSYDLTSALNGKYFDSVILTATGNNLWFSTPYRGVDPETSLTGSGSNAQGVDYFNNPGTKSFGFGISLTF